MPPKRADINETFSVTFGNAAENHKGMKIHGQDADRGLSHAELKIVAEKYPNSRIIDLRTLLPIEKRAEADEAYLLIIENGVEQFGIDRAELLTELANLPYDTKALMYGRVCNKHARHNNTFGAEYIAPDIANGQGTVVAFRDAPFTGS
jgi:hypothetical protein